MLSDFVATASQKSCWFCSTPITRDNASNEHVFPQWLQRDLRLEKVTITPTWHAEPLGELLDARKQTWGTLVAGRICAACNTGWMSDLETLALPVLRPLVRGERAVEELTAADARKVALWAVKTFLTLSAAVQEKRAPQNQYAALAGDPLSVPSHIHVFATQRDLTTGAHYTIDATWAQSRECATSEDAQAVKDTSYKACLQLGKLLLVVVWWPLGEEWVLAPEEDEYQLLAPAGAKLVWRPPPDPLPQDVVDAAGPELLAQMKTDAGAVAFGLTLSVKVFHRGDLPNYVLKKFGIAPLSATTSPPP